MVSQRARLIINSGPTRLAGELALPSGDRAVPGVVLCHALGAGKGALRDAANDLARKGVASLAIDLPGHGESGGVYAGDCTAAVLAAMDSLAALERVDRERMAVMGHSAGAREALLAAAERPDIRAVVCASCVADADGGVPGQGKGFFRRVQSAAARRVTEYPKDGPLPWLNGREAWTSRMRMRLAGERLRVDWQAAMGAWARKRPGLAILDMAPRPLLFLHCEGDAAVPALASVILYQKAARPKELLTPEGGSHDAPLTSSAVRALWTSWLARTLEAESPYAD